MDRDVTGDRIREALGKVKNPLGVLWCMPALPIDEDDPPDSGIIQLLQSGCERDESCR